MKVIGAKLRVLWDKDEIGDTGWKTGMKIS